MERNRKKCLWGIYKSPSIIFAGVLSRRSRRRHCSVLSGAETEEEEEERRAREQKTRATEETETKRPY